MGGAARRVGRRECPTRSIPLFPTHPKGETYSGCQDRSNANSLGGVLGGGSRGTGKSTELLEASLLLSGGDGSLGLESLGSAVGVTADIHGGDSGVALGVLLVLLDAVLGGVLQSHGESSSEILLSLLHSHGDAHSVGHLASVEHAVGGERRAAPVLAVPLGLEAVEPLGQAPNFIV